MATERQMALKRAAATILATTIIRGVAQGFIKRKEADPMIEELQRAYTGYLDGGKFSSNTYMQLALAITLSSGVSPSMDSTVGFGRQIRAKIDRKEDPGVLLPLALTFAKAVVNTDARVDDILYEAGFGTDGDWAGRDTGLHASSRRINGMVELLPVGNATEGDLKTRYLITGMLMEATDFSRVVLIDEGGLTEFQYGLQVAAEAYAKAGDPQSARTAWPVDYLGISRGTLPLETCKHLARLSLKLGRRDDAEHIALHMAAQAAEATQGL